MAPLEGLRGLISYVMTKCPRLRVCTAMVKTPYSGQRLGNDGGLGGGERGHMDHIATQEEQKQTNRL